MAFWFQQSHVLTHPQLEEQSYLPPKISKEKTSPYQNEIPDARRTMEHPASRGQEVLHFIENKR